MLKEKMKNREVICRNCEHYTLKKVPPADHAGGYCEYFKHETDPRGFCADHEFKCPCRRIIRQAAMKNTISFHTSKIFKDKCPYCKQSLLVKRKKL